MVLQVYNEDTELVWEAAMWVLAALATNDRLWVAIAAAGGLRLMCNASCAGQADLQVRSRHLAALSATWLTLCIWQVAAAAGLSALCEHRALCAHPSVTATCIREEGMWPLIAMAQSNHPEVQRVAEGGLFGVNHGRQDEYACE